MFLVIKAMGKGGKSKISLCFRRVSGASSQSFRERGDVI